MGCGASGKLPGSMYRIADQSRYLDAWFKALDLGDRITLVLHDWGGPIGFDWAHRHQDRIKGIAYMETLVLPLEWDDWPEVRRDLFQQFRSPMGEDLVLNDNFFVETIATRMVRDLPEAVMDTYRGPYLEPGESRRPTLTFTRECPIGGEPKDVIAMIERVGEWLSAAEFPKLFINAYPGSILTGRQRDYCRSCRTSKRKRSWESTTSRRTRRSRSGRRFQTSWGRWTDPGPQLLVRGPDPAGGVRLGQSSCRNWRESNGGTCARRPKAPSASSARPGPTESAMIPPSR